MNNKKNINDKVKRKQFYDNKLKELWIDWEEWEREKEIMIKQLELLLNNADENSFVKQRNEGYPLKQIKEDLNFYINFIKEDPEFQDVTSFYLAADRLEKFWITNDDEKTANELRMQTLGEEMPWKVVSILEYKK